MIDDFKMAWRNLWRNKRRTAITASSVFFAVFLAILMRSVQLGSYDRMIMNFIESYSGYLQIQNVKFKDSPSIDNTFILSDSLERAVLAVKNVVSVAPRIESFVLASNGPKTKGVIVFGIDPGKEKQFSNPENKLVKYIISGEAVTRLRKSALLPVPVLSKLEENLGSSYSSRSGMELSLGLTDSEISHYMDDILRSTSVSNGYLSDDDNGVLVSDRLARYLKIEIGDTVILMGQGYHGSSAAGIFPVRGIIKMPSPDIDSKMVIMSIDAARNFFDIQGRITSLAINLTGKSDRIINKARESIGMLLTDRNTVTRSWKDLNQVLVQQIQGDSETGIATLILLYFIIFFGIFGTVLMMIAERTREFGVLISLGMQRKRLKRIIAVEIALLGIIGLIAGMLISAPLVAHFYHHPVQLKGDLSRMMMNYGWDAVMPTAWFGPYFYRQALIVSIMIVAAIIYPVRKISRLKEIEALRS